MDVGGPALAYSAFLDDLERIVQPLVHEPLDPSALAASVVSAMQPHLVDLAERATPSTSSSQVTVAEPAALEKVDRNSTFPNDDVLVNAIITALETRLARPSSRQDSDAQLEQAEAGLAVLSPLDLVQSALEAVKAGQERLLDTLKAHKLSSPTATAPEELEQVVHRVVKAVASSSTSADKARFADLETQCVTSLSPLHPNSTASDSSFPCLQARQGAQRARQSSQRKGGASRSARRGPCATCRRAQQASRSARGAGDRARAGRGGEAACARGARGVAGRAVRFGKEGRSTGASVSQLFHLFLAEADVFNTSCRTLAWTPCSAPRWSSSRRSPSPTSAT